MGFGFLLASLLSQPEGSSSKQRSPFQRDSVHCNKSAVICERQRDVAIGFDALFQCEVSPRWVLQTALGEREAKQLHGLWVPTV